jgi:uncharacterized membrane protein YphA (DoxX/SURF4 family)
VRGDPDGDAQLGVSAPCAGDVVLICRCGSVWALGHVWTAECVLGQLCPIPGLYGYAHLVLPPAIIPPLAMASTIAEALLGLLLVLGWNTRIVALLSGTLLTTFALTMTMALGVKAPLNLSVFSAAGGALVLGACTDFPFSVDEGLRWNRQSRSVRNRLVGDDRALGDGQAEGSQEERICQPHR